MNKNEILDILRKYNFDFNEYMVISDASLVLQGIKEKTDDINIAVSQKYYDYLISNYDIEFEKENLGIKRYYINRVINFNTNYYNRDEVIMYEGFPIQNLEGIRKLKVILSSDENLNDINLIDKYLYLNPLALAYIGDAVYELNIRKYLVTRGITRVNDLTSKAKEYVSAKKQAIFVQELITKNFFKENELEIIRRGRNSKSHKAPKNTDIVTYKYSTGFEALIGYLYLENNIDRINEIIKEIIGE